MCFVVVGPILKGSNPVQSELIVPQLRGKCQTTEHVPKNDQYFCDASVTLVLMSMSNNIFV